jgi:hypothetical protein
MIEMVSVDAHRETWRGHDEVSGGSKIIVEKRVVPGCVQCN